MALVYVSNEKVALLAHGLTKRQLPPFTEHVQVDWIHLGCPRPRPAHSSIVCSPRVVPSTYHLFSLYPSPSHPKPAGATPPLGLCYLLYLLYDMCNKKQAPQCQKDDCPLTVYVDESTGRVHNFCGRRHADEAVAIGSLSSPTSRRGDALVTKGTAMCKVQGCHELVFRDPWTKKVSQSELWTVAFV